MEEKLHKLWTRDYDVYLCYGASRSLYNNKGHLLYATKDVFIFPNGKNREIYLSEEDYQKQWKVLNDYYVKDIKNFIPYCNDLINAGELFVEKSIEITNNVSKISESELSKRYTQFIEIFVEYFTWLWSSFILNEEMSSELKMVIESLDLSAEEKHDLLMYANSPVKNASILLLAEESKKKTIEELRDEFAWITTLNVYDSPASIEDIKNRISKGDNIKITVPASLASLDEHTRNLIEASRYNAYVKDRRDDFRRMGTYHILPLYEEIANRLTLERKELSFLLPSEIDDALNKKSTSSELKAKTNMRVEQGFFMHWHDNKLDFTDDVKKITELKNQFRLYEVVQTNVKEFKGTIGCKGKITGAVKVVTTAKELDKVKEGDILVAVTTNPDYLQGMERSSAFITDEGGMTCHAAILAREMKKPCIVGTKIATKVLKDGDMVEVDAEKGIVKII